MENFNQHNYLTSHVSHIEVDLDPEEIKETLPDHEEELSTRTQTDLDAMSAWETQSDLESLMGLTTCTDGTEAKRCKIDNLQESIYDYLVDGERLSIERAQEFLTRLSKPIAQSETEVSWKMIEDERERPENCCTEIGLHAIRRVYGKELPTLAFKLFKHINKKVIGKVDYKGGRLFIEKFIGALEANPSKGLITWADTDYTLVQGKFQFKIETQIAKIETSKANRVFYPKIGQNTLNPPTWYKSDKFGNSDIEMPTEMQNLAYQIWDLCEKEEMNIAKIAPLYYKYLNESPERTSKFAQLRIMDLHKQNAQSFGSLILRRLAYCRKQTTHR